MKPRFFILAALAAMAALQPLAPVHGQEAAPTPAAFPRMPGDKTDPRIIEMAARMVQYCGIKEGEHVLISVTCAPDDLVVELIRAVRAVGAIPHARIHHSRVEDEMMAGATDEQFELEARLLMEESQAMDVIFIISGLPSPALNRTSAHVNAGLANKHLIPVSLVRHDEKRWCAVNWPTAAQAQLAGMDQRDLLDYYLDCCLLDFTPMRPAMEKLKGMMEATDVVRIVGPGTDLTFSIKGIPAVVCCGEYNLPDGEVFTAPVRESINGTLHVNLPTAYGGYVFEDFTLHFENGRIVKVECEDEVTQVILWRLIGRDEDSHYMGEFALGVHPYMPEPILDTLFDEKIAGSFHMAIGRCIPFTPNGNDNTVLHWDLVISQTPEHSGGEIYFNGQLIRKDGVFIDPELAPLNPQKIDK